MMTAFLFCQQLLIRPFPVSLREMDLPRVGQEGEGVLG